MPRKEVSDKHKALFARLSKRGLTVTEIFNKLDGLYSMSTIRTHTKAEPVYATAKTTKITFKKEMYSKEISEKFAKLLEVSINPETDFAYTGASLEFLLNIAELGFMPQSAFQNAELRFVMKECAEVVEVSKNFAYFSAQCGYVFQRLNADFEDFDKICQLKNIKDLGTESSDENYSDLLLNLVDKYRRSATTILNFCEKSNEVPFDGCIIILSENLAKDHKVYDSYSNKVIKVPEKGLNLDYITGIEPLSNHEWDILKQFQA